MGEKNMSNLIIMYFL